MEDDNLTKHSSFQREGHTLITLRTTEVIRRPPESRSKECQLSTYLDPYQLLFPPTIAVKLLIKSPLGGESF